MSVRLCAVAALTWTLVATADLARAAVPEPAEPVPVTARAAAKASVPLKIGAQSARLLLPLYVVNTVDPVSGPTTFWAVRNESDTLTVNVLVRYYEPDKPAAPQFQETVVLAPKAAATFDLRARIGDLEVDPDGLARGYVILESEGGEAVLHGDYFSVDDAGDFASGFRLVDIDPDSRTNDLCTRFSIRFLDSSLLFDSGTVFTVWFDPADPYEGDAFNYFAYDLAGNVVLFLNFPSSRFAFQISASALLFNVDEEFGVIEFQFPAGTEGHVSAVMSAFGRFSVGFEATCLDAD